MPQQGIDILAHIVVPRALAKPFGIELIMRQGLAGHPGQVLINKVLRVFGVRHGRGFRICIGEED